jgi:uncharacterized membrane protein
MRILGTILLILLGLGVFPFNMRTLFTGPGIMLASISLVLWVIAYRLATKKKAQQPE